MTRLVDTLAAFEGYARKAALQSPVQREGLWIERYEKVYPEVFEAFYASYGSPAGRTAVVKELTNVRKRVEEAAPVVREHIRDLDVALPELLGVPPEPSPTHVLMVGTLSTNATVGRLGDDVAVFHCLEWYQGPEPAKVLVAHEATHAWHQLKLGPTPPDDDMAWTTFSEGLALQASKAAVPGRPDDEYFWYGHPQEEDWLEWCKKNGDGLRTFLRDHLDDPKSWETLFGAGFIEGRWRVGYYLAADVVAGLGLTLPELMAMTAEEGKEAVREALGAPPAPASPPVETHGAPAETEAESETTE